MNYYRIDLKYKKLKNRTGFPLHEAIFKNDFGKVKNLLQTGENIYKPVKDGETPLELAVGLKNEQLALLILKQYRKDMKTVKSKLPNQISKALVLIAHGPEQIKKALVLKDKYSNDLGLNPVVIYLPQIQDVVLLNAKNAMGRVEILELIETIRPNGRLSLNSSTGQTPALLMTVANKMKELSVKMEKLGADVDIEDVNGCNAFLIASMIGSISFLKFLIEKYSNRLNFIKTNNSNGCNAFKFAIMKCDEELVEKVIDAMLSFRVNKFQESIEQAFNEILRDDSKEYPNTSFFQYFRPNHIAFANKILPNYFEKYKVDLTRKDRWGTPVLVQMIQRKFCIEFCKKVILEDLNNLLFLDTDNSNTIIVEYFLKNEHKFLCKIYEKSSKLQDLLRNKDFLMKTADLWSCKKDFVEFLISKNLNFFQHNLEIAEKICQLNISLKELMENKLNYIEMHVPQHENLKNEKTIFEIVQENNLNKIKTLENLDLVDKDGNHAVLFVKSIEMLKYFIENCPEGELLVHKTNNEGLTLLHKACNSYEKLQIDFLTYIISLGADVNARTKNGETVLFYANRYEIINLLVSKGAIYPVTDYNGNTIIHKFLKWCPWIANFYLEMDSTDFSSINNDGTSFLSILLETYGQRSLRDWFDAYYRETFEKHPEKTQKMFDAVFSHSKENASQIFQQACVHSVNFIVEKFLDYDLDFNYNTSRYYEIDRPPIVALISYQEEPNFYLIERLLEKNVDLNKCCEYGQNALIALTRHFKTFCWYNKEEEACRLICLLVESGADLNFMDKDGNTALHYAFKQDSLKAIRMLLHYEDVDMSIRNCEGKTAIEMGSKDTQLLLNYLKPD